MSTITKASGFTLCSLLFIMLLPGCRSVGIENSNEPSAASDVRITSNEFPEWSEDSGSYLEFDVQALYGIINGGAIEYQENGMIEGITQKLYNGEKTMALWANYFGTAEKALAMFNSRMSLYSDNDRVTILPFELNIAAGSTVLGGVTVYAHFDSFYFEVTATGYMDNANSVSDASQFLQIFQSNLK